MIKHYQQVVWRVTRMVEIEQYHLFNAGMSSVEIKAM